MTTEQHTDDYDGPWKEAIETYFEDCLAFFFPNAHAGIDWSKGYEFLDKELQQVVPEAELGRRTTDKLVKVWQKTGQETWVLIHIEVQSQYETDFAERMYIYNYHLFDRYKRRVASLAILGDEAPAWRPTRYGYELWGCQVSLIFPVVKLLDYAQDWATLENNRNPFAVVIMAHLHTQATRHKPDERYMLKWNLTRRLYERGYSKQEVLTLFRFIDWLMALPPVLKQRFEETLIAYEEAYQMTYMTTFEKEGLEKGLQQGLEQGLERGLQQGLQQGILQKAREDVIAVLEIRFKTIPEPLIETVYSLEDTDTLEALHKQAVICESLDQFERDLEHFVADHSDQEPGSPDEQIKSENTD